MLEDKEAMKMPLEGLGGSNMRRGRSEWREFFGGGGVCA